MSRTDKTRPLWVRMMDNKDFKIGAVETHNHVKGYCDLPAKNPKAIEEHYDKLMSHESLSYRESCHYSFSYQGVGMCGCTICTAQAQRKQERRGHRHNTKTSLLNHKKAVNATLQANSDLDEEFEFLEPEDEKVPSVTW